MLCRICSSNTRPAFTHKVLRKYDCRYYFCNNCADLQTENPYCLIGWTKRMPAPWYRRTPAFCGATSTLHGSRSGPGHRRTIGPCSRYRFAQNRGECR